MKIYLEGYYELFIQWQKFQELIKVDVCVRSRDFSTVCKLHLFLTTFIEVDQYLAKLMELCRLKLHISSSMGSLASQQAQGTTQPVNNEYKSFISELSKIFRSLRSRGLYKWFKSEKFEVALINNELCKLYQDENEIKNKNNSSGAGNIYSNQQKGNSYSIALEKLMKVIKNWANIELSYPKNSFIKIFDRSHLFTFPTFCLLNLHFNSLNLIEISFYYFCCTSIQRFSTTEGLKNELFKIGTKLLREHLSYKHVTLHSSTVSSNLQQGHESNALSNNLWNSLSIQPSSPTSTSHSVVGVNIIENPSNSQESKKLIPTTFLPPLFLETKPLNKLMIRYSSKDTINKGQVGNELSEVPLHQRQPTSIMSVFMVHKRKIWVIDNLQTIKTIIEMIIQLRLKEGFLEIDNGDSSIHAFIAEVPLQEGSKLSCTFEYMIFKSSPNLLVTEFWMEPQYGFYQSEFGENFLTKPEILFNNFIHNIATADNRIITGLWTFQALKEAPRSNSLSNRHSIKNLHYPSSDQMNFYYPQLCINSILFTALKTLHTYDLFHKLNQNDPSNAPSISISTNNPSTSDNIIINLQNHHNQSNLLSKNEILSTMLEDELHSLSDCEIDTKNSTWHTLIMNDNQRCRCFVKLINTGVILAIVPMINELDHSVSVNNANSTPAANTQSATVVNNANLATSGGLSISVDNVNSTLDHDYIDCGDIIGKFAVAFFECSLSQLLSYSLQSKFTLRDLINPSFKIPEYKHQSIIHIHHQNKDNLSSSTSAPSAGSIQGRSTAPTLQLPSTVSATSNSATFLSTSGNLPTTSSISFSAASKQIFFSLKYAYEHSYAKGVYTNLKEKLPMLFIDLQKALDFCSEYPIDIDITQFFRILQKSSDQHNDSVVKEIPSTFSQILSPLFTSIEGSRYFYYSAEQFSDSQKANHSSDDEESVEMEYSQEIDYADTMDLHHDDSNYLNGSSSSNGSANTTLLTNNTILNQLLIKDQQLLHSKSLMGVYPYPFFLSMECQIDYGTIEGNSYSKTIIVTSIPTLTFILQQINQTSSSVTFTKVIFRLIRITLSSNSTSLAMNSVMDHMRSSIQTLISKEILVAMMGVLPITNQLLDIVLYNFNRITSSSKKVQFSLDLYLLDNDLGESLLVNELEKSFCLPLKRINDILFTIQPLSASPLSSGNLSMDPSTHDSPPPSFTKQHPLLSTRGASNPSMQVSNATKLSPILHSSLNEIDSSFPHLQIQVQSQSLTSSISPRNKQQVVIYTIPYWLIVTHRGTTIDVLFFSHSLSTVERSRILSEVRACIRSFCDRINQLILLRQLHDTRHCNELLIPLSSNHKKDKNSAEQQKLQVKKQARSFFFNHFPGQFECQLVHSIHLHVHSRVPGPQASLELVNSSLNPFQVNNRQDVFVYQDEQKNVYYMKLKLIQNITTTPATNPNPSNSIINNPPGAEPNNATAESVHQQTESLNSFEQVRKPTSPTKKAGGIHQSASLTNLQAVATASGSGGNVATKTTTIQLDIYGVDPPGEEITKQLSKLLEHKLLSITARVLSENLMRNPKLRLTNEDLNFLIHPIDSMKEETIYLPSIINPSIYNYLIHLRQNLLQSLLFCHFKNNSTSDRNSLNVNSNTIGNHRHSTLQSLKPTDFQFIYNHLQNLPNSISTIVGPGLCYISLHLIHCKSNQEFYIPLSNSSVSSPSIPLSSNPSHLSKEEDQLRDWKYLFSYLFARNGSAYFHHPIYNHNYPSSGKKRNSLEHIYDSLPSFHPSAHDESHKNAHSSDSGTSGDGKDANKILKSWELLENDQKISDSEYLIKFKIYSHSPTIKIDLLTNYLLLSIKQTLIEHSLENLFFPKILPRKSFENHQLELIQFGFDVAIENQVPSMNKSIFSLNNIPSWSFLLFVKEIIFILQQFINDCPENPINATSSENNPLFPILYFSYKQGPLVYLNDLFEFNKHHQIRAENKDFFVFYIYFGSFHMDVDEIKQKNKLYLDEFELFHVEGRKWNSFIKITCSELVLSSYNWSLPILDDFQKSITRLLNWNDIRMHLLSTILHQKLGLLRHISSFIFPALSYIYHPPSSSPTSSSSSSYVNYAPPTPNPDPLSVPPKLNQTAFPLSNPSTSASNPSVNLSAATCWFFLFLFIFLPLQFFSPFPFPFPSFLYLPRMNFSSKHYCVFPQFYSPLLFLITVNLQYDYLNNELILPFV